MPRVSCEALCCHLCPDARQVDIKYAFVGDGSLCPGLCSGK